MKKILVINGDNSTDVSAVTITVEKMRKSLGVEGVVDVITYDGGAHGYKGTTQELEGIIDASIGASKVTGKYDMILVCGKHGDCKVLEDGSVKRTLFNGLNDEQAGILISKLKNTGATAKSIVLGTCYSANYAEDFKPLLDKQGTLLSCTTISPENFLNLGEATALGKIPDLGPSVSSSLTLSMSDAAKRRRDLSEAAERKDEQVLSLPAMTPLEEKLLEMSEYKAYSKVAAQTALVDNLADGGITLGENYHNLISYQERMEIVNKELMASNVSGKEDVCTALLASSAALGKIYSDFLEDPKVAELKKANKKNEALEAEYFIKSCRKLPDPEIREAIRTAMEKLEKDAKAYDDGAKPMKLKEALDAIGPGLRSQQDDEAQKFMTAAAPLIREAKGVDAIDSPDWKLKCSLESSYCMFDGKTTYVNKIEYVPKASILEKNEFNDDTMTFEVSTEKKEYAEQLAQSHGIVAAIKKIAERSSSPVVPFDAEKLPQLYAEAVSKTATNLLEEVEIYDPSDILPGDVVEVASSGTPATADYKELKDALVEMREAHKEQPSTEIAVGNTASKPS